jgi:uncharacterized protein YndB with AHSA1/START domain
MAHLRISRHVAAPAEVVYDLVADLPRMGEWSPETERVLWRGDATGPAVGARFIGWNRRGAVRWFTQGEVVEAERGHRFAFEITLGPVKVARWEYVLEPDADGQGCTVSEEWTERRPRFARLSDAAMGPRQTTNVTGMERTLDALARAAESVFAP